MARLNVTSEEYALNFRFFFKAVSDSRGSLTKAFHNGHFDSQSECLLKVMNLVGAVILLSWKIKVMVGWFCIIDCVMISVTVKSCSGGPVWSVHLWWGFLHSLAVRTAPPPCRTCNEPQGSGRLGGRGGRQIWGLQAHIWEPAESMRWEDLGRFRIWGPPGWPEVSWQPGFWGHMKVTNQNSSTLQDFDPPCAGKSLSISRRVSVHLEQQHCLL